LGKKGERTARGGCQEKKKIPRVGNFLRRETFPHYSEGCEKKISKIDPNLNWGKVFFVRLSPERGKRITGGKRKRQGPPCTRFLAQGEKKKKKRELDKLISWGKGGK